ncbi:hypothetical protein LINGRAHAP2_LOCUS34657 [Linum grandiflorum]
MATQDDHVAEVTNVVHLERWHFHDQYMVWYRGFTRRWTLRRSAVHESVVSMRHHFI